MHVERYGTGEAVYFGLHGWGGDHRTFAPLAARLPEGATLYAADLPGYGRSPAPRQWTLEAIIDEIADAVARTGAGRLTVIGNCSGANLGLLAAAALGERAARFVLIDPFAYMPWYFKVFVSPGWGRYAYYSAFANPVGRWVTNLSLRNRRTADSDLTGSFRRVNHEASYQYLRLLAQVEGVERFRGLRMPIDILYGERTFAAVKESAALWRGVWPQARCVELTGAGHLPIEEATEQLIQIIFAPQLSLSPAG